jgi:hypothetical protein
MQTGARRGLVVWSAQHDNGWSTAVIERRDRTFAAAAGPGDAVAVTNFHDTVHDACAAAKSALQHRTGHAVCSPLCSEWALTLTKDATAEPLQLTGVEPQPQTH